MKGKLIPVEIESFSARFTGKPFSELSKEERPKAIKQLMVEAATIYGYDPCESEEHTEQVVSTFIRYIANSAIFREYTEAELVFALYVNLRSREELPKYVEFDEAKKNSRYFNIADYSLMLRNYSGLRRLLENKTKQEYENRNR